jgi:hypothetical protein
LRYVLLRVCVSLPTELGIDGGDLVRGQSGAPPESHVFLGMRHARKTVGCIIATDQVVLLDGDHGGERISDDDDAQSILERCLGNFILMGAFLPVGEPSRHEHKR